MPNLFSIHSAIDEQENFKTLFILGFGHYIKTISAVALSYPTHNMKDHSPFRKVTTPSSKKISVTSRTTDSVSQQSSINNSGQRHSPFNHSPISSKGQVQKFWPIPKPFPTLDMSNLQPRDFKILTASRNNSEKQEHCKSNWYMAQKMDPISRHDSPGTINSPRSKTSNDVGMTAYPIQKPEVNSLYVDLSNKTITPFHQAPTYRPRAFISKAFKNRCDETVVRLQTISLRSQFESHDL